MAIYAVKLPEYTKGIQLASASSEEAMCRNSRVLECNDCRNIRVCDVEHKIVALIQCSGLTPYCNKDKCSAIPDENSCSSDTLCPAPNRFFPNILNCKEYHFCNPKKMIIRYECPPKYVYDQKTTFCKLPSSENTCAQVDCKSSANRNQLIPYPTDHSIFVYCDEARNRSVLLVCDEGEQYEAETLSCEFACQKEGHFAYKDDCRKYNACYSNGSSGFFKIVTECPPGMLFHPTSRVCDINLKYCPSILKRNITKEIIAKNSVESKFELATEIITSDEDAKKLKVPVIPVTDSKSIGEILKDLKKTVNISMDSKTQSKVVTQLDNSQDKIDSTGTVENSRKTNETRRQSRKTLGVKSEQTREMEKKSKPKEKITTESRIARRVASHSEKTTQDATHLRVKKIEQKSKTKVQIGKEENKTKEFEKESKGQFLTNPRTKAGIQIELRKTEGQLPTHKRTKTGIKIELSKTEDQFTTHLKSKTGIGKESNKTKISKTNQETTAQSKLTEELNAADPIVTYLKTNSGSLKKSNKLAGNEKKPNTTAEIEKESMTTAGNEYIKNPMAEILTRPRTIVEVAMEPTGTEEVTSNSNKSGENSQTQSRIEETATKLEIEELMRKENNKIDAYEKQPNLNGQVATHPKIIAENEKGFNKTGETVTYPNTTTGFKNESNSTDKIATLSGTIENLENEPTKIKVEYMSKIELVPKTKAENAQITTEELVRTSTNTLGNEKEISARNKYASNTVEGMEGIRAPKETVKVVNESTTREATAEIATAPIKTVRVENELTEVTASGTEPNTAMENNTKPIIINEVPAVEPEIIEDVEEEPRMEGIGRRSMAMEQIKTESKDTTKYSDKTLSITEAPTAAGIENVTKTITETNILKDSTTPRDENVPKLTTEDLKLPDVKEEILNEEITTIEKMKTSESKTKLQTEKEIRNFLGSEKERHATDQSVTLKTTEAATVAKIDNVTETITAMVRIPITTERSVKESMRSMEYVTEPTTAMDISKNSTTAKTFGKESNTTLENQNVQNIPTEVRELPSIIADIANDEMTKVEKVRKPKSKLQTEKEFKKSLGSEKKLKSTNQVMLSKTEADAAAGIENITKTIIEMVPVSMENAEITKESNTTVENENADKLTKEVVKVPGTIEEIANEVTETEGKVKKSIKRAGTEREQKSISEIVSVSKTTMGNGNESFVRETTEEIETELKNVSKSGISSKIIADILTDSRANAHIIANSLLSTLKTLNNKKVNATTNSAKKVLHLPRSGKSKGGSDLIRIFVDPRNLTSIVFTDVDVV